MNMIINDILKDCRTEKDVIALSKIMANLVTIKEMIDGCCNELNNFTFLNEELVNLNRLIFEMKGLLSDFDYAKMKSILEK